MALDAVEFCQMLCHDCSRLLRQCGSSWNKMEVFRTNDEFSIIKQPYILKIHSPFYYPQFMQRQQRTLIVILDTSSNEITIITELPTGLH